MNLFAVNRLRFYKGSELTEQDKEKIVEFIKKEYDEEPEIDEREIKFLGDMDLDEILMLEFEGYDEGRINIEGEYADGVIELYRQIKNLLTKKTSKGEDTSKMISLFEGF